MGNELKKKYGLFTAIAMVVGIVIGSGVFFKAEAVLKATGGNMPLGIAAWAIGMRNARKAILNACLAPVASIREAEYAGEYTTRFARLEDRKTLPFGAVWARYCEEKNIPQDGAWLAEVQAYERSVLSARG